MVVKCGQSHRPGYSYGFVLAERASACHTDQLVTRTPITSLTRGYIDDFCAMENGRGRLRGWLFRETDPIARVDIKLNGHVWTCGLALYDRPDVQAAYKDSLGVRPHLTRSAFDIIQSLPPGISDFPRTLIEIAPIGDDGRKFDPLLTHFCPIGDRAGAAPVPPIELQERVGDSGNFLLVRANLTTLVMTQLHKYKPDFLSSRILDWGCGCGRVLSQLRKFVPANLLFGCDIDAAAIAWDRDNLPGPAFIHIDPYPPTSYRNEFFQVIYGISVMTHLAEESQLQWLEELQRISAPNAILALSVIGKDLRQTNMPAALRTTFEAKGFVSQVPNYSSIWDKFSHRGYYRESYHSLEYIEGSWGKYFEILEYLQTGHQDLVLLRSHKR